MISRGLWRSRPSFDLLRPHHARRHDDAQRRDVPPVGLGVEGAQDGLGERVADDRGGVDAVALHVVEELLGAEVATLHRGDRPADHQVADGVEQPGAVHQRRCGHVARAGLVDPFGDGLEVLFGRHALLVVRVEHAEQVVLAPHHTLGHAGGAAGVEQQEVVARCGPRARCTLSSVPAAAASSYGVAHSGHGPDPSSTQSHSA